MATTKSKKSSVHGTAESPIQEQISATEFKLLNEIPEENLKIKNKGPWRSRRLHGDFISITDMAAISLDIRPKFSSTLSENTIPTLSLYKDRIHRIFELVNAGEIDLKSKHSLPLDEADVHDILISFSQTLDFAYEARMPLPEWLVKLDLSARKKTNKHIDENFIIEADAKTDANIETLKTNDQIKSSISEDKHYAAEKHESTDVWSLPVGGRLENNLLITFGALLILLGRYASNGSVIPKSLIRGKTLNKSALTEHLVLIIKKSLSKGEEKPGHSEDAVRRTIEKMLKKFPPNVYENLIADFTDPGDEIGLG